MENTGKGSYIEGYTAIGIFRISFKLAFKFVISFLQHLVLHKSGLMKRLPRPI